MAGRTVATRLIAAGVVVIATVTLVALALTNTALLGFRLRATDAFQPSGPTSDRLVVVELDPETYREFGAPLPRTVLADLVDAIATTGAAVIVLDVVLDATAADDPRRPAAIRAAAAQEDARLTEAIDAAGNVVLAVGGDVVATDERGAFELQRPLLPLPSFSAAARSLAVAAVASDPDQVVRSLPLYAIPQGERVEIPSLALAAVGLADAADAGAADDPVVRLRPDGVQVGTRAVPADDAGVMGLNFTPQLRDGATGVPAITARDLLAGERPRQLEDAIVLVGATGPLSGDRFRTPAGTLSGVYLHANAVNSILTGFARSLPPSAPSTLVVVGVLAAIVAVAGAVSRLRWLPLVVVGVLMTHLVVTEVAWQRGDEIDVVYPWLAAIAVAVSLVAFRYVTEVRDRRRVLATFGEYVPPGAVEQLLDRERYRAASEGERVDVTVLFADLRGFTAASADRDPKDVRAMLEHFYERAAGIVFDHGGTVMQYVGDEVFAVFGAPTPMTDHAARAVAAAVVLRDSGPAINAELAERDLPPIAYGIGLNAGPVVAGHVGNRYRRQYAVVGDTVNVGSRLCSAAGAGEVVVSGSVHDRASIDDEARPLTGVALKGVDRDVGARVLAGGEPPG